MLQTFIDALVVVALSVVRIGLPLVIVFAIGNWLQRKLRPPEEFQAARAERKDLPRWMRRVADEIDALPAWLPTVGLVTGLGVAAGIYRLVVGLGASTNLNQGYPWGLWIGFDLFMVALSGGAFTLATLVYVFQMHRFHAAIRPTILTGLLGYTSVLIILVMDLGRWDRFYHFIIYPNLNSALFEVSWCILLYTTVLVTEFSPLVMQKFGWHRAIAIMQKITLPLVIVGATLSTLHQSSLGSLFVIMTARLHPLWYTAFIPLLFFITSIAAGLAVVVGGATASYWVFRRSLTQKLVADLALFIPWILGLYLTIRLGDLLANEKLPLILHSGIYSVLFLTEIGIGAVLPIILFNLKPVLRGRGWSFIGATLVLGGVFLNRFDAAWFAQIPTAGYSYMPSIAEILIQVGVLAGIVFIYTLIGHYLPLFEGTIRPEEEEKPLRRESPKLRPAH